MSTLELIELILLAVVAIALILFYSYKAIKNGWVKKITDTAKKAIKEAEQSGKSGAEKQAYVLEQVSKKCEELGIPFKLIQSLVIKFIQQVIAGYNTIIK